MTVTLTATTAAGLAALIYDLDRKPLANGEAAPYQLVRLEVETQDDAQGDAEEVAS